MMAYRVTSEAQQRREARRGQIVAAAAALFATQGYNATTMQQVVRAAGTSIGNCYFYFPNKEALLRAVVDQINTDVGNAIDRAIAGADPGLPQIAIALYTGAMEFAARQDVARVALIEAAQLGLQNVMIEHFGARIARVFAAQPALLRGQNAELAVIAWQGAAINVLQQMLINPALAPEDVGRFIARWNIQALGLPADRVEAAMDGLESWIAKGATR
jgi:AcrR family transcriptional regulator